MSFSFLPEETHYELGDVFDQCLLFFSVQGTGLINSHLDMQVAHQIGLLLIIAGWKKKASIGTAALIKRKCRTYESVSLNTVARKISTVPQSPVYSLLLLCEEMAVVKLSSD